MDDSVIICEPSGSNFKKKAKRRLQKLKARRNKHQEMPKSSERWLHDRYIDDCNQNTPPKAEKKNLKRRRSGNDKLPAKKRQKIFINETIILSDDDDSTCIPDVVLIPPQMPEKPPPRRSARQQQMMAAKLNNKINEMSPEPQETLPKEDDDLAVVWSSTDTDKSEILKKNPKSEAESSIFFIDTTGDARNLNANCLSPKQDNWFHCLLLEPPRLSPVKAKKKPFVTVSPRVEKSKPVKSSSGKANPAAKDKSEEKSLREIIIDGSNVGYGFSHNKEFTKNGIQLVLDYFHNRGHKVKIFLPQHYRKRDRQYLEQWYNLGHVVFTPSRNIGGKKIVPYDDRFIIDYATRCNGIVVSSDQFRDLWKEKPEWRETIEKRLLPPTFAGDCVLFPDDPLGRAGPNLDTFLKH